MVCSIRCLLILLITEATVNGLPCIELNENSTISQQNEAWRCDVIKWRNDFAKLKLRVEQQCSVNDDDDYWKSVFECPSFSEISCVNESSLQIETDSLNCSLTFCGDGNYVDQTFLQRIWIYHHNANRKFMLALRNNFSHCIESAGSSLNVTCPYLKENATEAEMNEAWMCEFVKWRDILAEWKNRVEEQCSVSDEDSNWGSAFECPNFSDIQCLDGTAKLNKTDNLNCQISLCADGSYSDESPLRSMSRNQFETREYIMTTFTNNDLQCATRDSTDATAKANDGTDNSMTTTDSSAEFTGDSTVGIDLFVDYTSSTETTTGNSIDFTIPVDSTSPFHTYSTADGTYNPSETAMFSTMSTGNDIASTPTANAAAEYPVPSTQIITEVITNSESTTEAVTSSSATSTSITTEDRAPTALATTSLDLVGWSMSGNMYYACFMDVKRTYADAKASCGSYGGRLAAKVLRDPVAVSDIITSGCTSNAHDHLAWIGFDDIETEGDWRWSDGGSMSSSTTEWHPTEPNGAVSENCANFQKELDGKLLLHDYPCDRQFNYLCEIVNPSY